jgi:hypothetical protein
LSSVVVPINMTAESIDSKKEVVIDESTPD